MSAASRRLEVAPTVAAAVRKRASSSEDNRIAINATLRKVLHGYVTDPEAFRRATDALLPLFGRDPPARWAHRREVAITRMKELRSAGEGRAAASLVARELATDPRDAREVEILGQQIRRWWRTRKTETNSVRLKAPKSD